MNLKNLREEYRSQGFDKADADPDPFEQFRRWFREAQQAEMPEPNAMTLATATAYGRPSARIVLLKELDAQGFVFYTNYESRKGIEMAMNPYASLLFCWLDLQRQIRIEGTIEKVSREESESYFQSRPKNSQIGAWASQQSNVIPNREYLENTFAAIADEYKHQDVLPLPETWGGYRLKPTAFEFWQGRESRLHDRLAYTPDGLRWKIERLSP